MPGEGGDGALAVGAGDGEHRRPVMPGEELDVAEHRNAAGERLDDERIAEREAGADAHQIDRREQRVAEGTEMDVAGELGEPRRLGPGVGDANARAMALGVARYRKTGIAEAEDQQAPPGEGEGLGPRQQADDALAHHRSLSVERPKSTSIMVMIQKRTTTWLSFQPSSS